MSRWDEEDQLEDSALHDDVAAEEADDFPALVSSTLAPSVVPSSHTATTTSPWNKLFKQASPSLSAPPAQPVRLPFINKLDGNTASASLTSTTTQVKGSATASTAASDACNSAVASSSATASSSSSASSTSASTSVTHLILDTGAFISGQVLTTYGPHCTYITLPAVKAELRDPVSQHRFSTFPFPLTLRTPPAEAIAAVSAFAAQTGDRRSLSAVDVSVLAMAWQVEREVNGGRWLKEKVEGRNEQAIEAILASRGQTTTIAADGKQTQLEEDSEQLDDDLDQEDDDAGQDDAQDSEGEWEQPTAAAAAETKADSSQWQEQKESPTDDDGEGRWITPDNLHQQADLSAQRPLASDHPSSVATITTDYAMQVQQQCTDAHISVSAGRVCGGGLVCVVWLVMIRS